MGNLQGSVSRLSNNSPLKSLFFGSVLAVSGLMITACGSSEADKSADPIKQSQSENRPGLEETSRGQFVDSAVSGLFYKTGSQEGFTDHNGYFDYLPEETVSFAIGNIQLGSAEASSIVTPLDLSPSIDDGLNDAAVNILRLLQTLDEDGDPSNGISISESTHIAATRVESGAINVNVDIEAFESNPNLVQFIGQATNVSDLVEYQRAVAHFQETRAQLLSE